MKHFNSHQCSISLYIFTHIVYPDRTSQDWGMFGDYKPSPLLVQGREEVGGKGDSLWFESGLSEGSEYQGASRRKSHSQCRLGGNGTGASSRQGPLGTRNGVQPVYMSRREVGPGLPASWAVLRGQTALWGR